MRDVGWMEISSGGIFSLELLLRWSSNIKNSPLEGTLGRKEMQFFLIYIEKKITRT